MMGSYSKGLDVRFIEKGPIPVTCTNINQFFKNKLQVSKS